ncbi:MAG: DUF4157 domain-containing protein [bacterium]|nr:DUF4157 domain-containing protein [bacterium]
MSNEENLPGGGDEPVKSNLKEKTPDIQEKKKKKPAAQKDPAVEYMMSLQKTVGNQEATDSLGIQPRLKVGDANDIYEKEADRVADQVVNMSEADVQTKSGTHMVQAAGSPEGTTVSPEVESGIKNLKGSGSPLNKSTRGFYEKRLNSYLDKVRVHTGPKADKLAKAVNARAFTSGHDIVFANKEFNPDSKEGKKLLAHELTHVVQQKGKGGSKISRKSNNTGSQGLTSYQVRRAQLYNEGKLSEEQIDSLRAFLELPLEGRIDADFINAVLKWQQGKNITSDGKVTAATMNNFKNHGYNEPLSEAQIEEAVSYNSKNLSESQVGDIRQFLDLPKGGVDSAFVGGVALWQGGNKLTASGMVESGTMGKLESNGAIQGEDLQEKVNRNKEEVNVILDDFQQTLEAVYADSYEDIRDRDEQAAVEHLLNNMKERGAYSSLENALARLGIPMPRKTEYNINGQVYDAEHTGSEQGVPRKVRTSDASYFETLAANEETVARNRKPLVEAVSWENAKPGYKENITVFGVSSAGVLFDESERGVIKEYPVELELKDNPESVETIPHKLTTYKDAQHLYNDLGKMMSNQKSSFMPEAFEQRFGPVFASHTAEWDKHLEAIDDKRVKCGLREKENLSWDAVEMILKDIQTANTLGISAFGAFLRSIEPDPDPDQIAGMLSEWSGAEQGISGQVREKANKLLNAYFQNGVDHKDAAQLVDLLWNAGDKNNAALQEFDKKVQEFNDLYHSSKEEESLMRKIADEGFETGMPEEYKKLWEVYTHSKDRPGTKPGDPVNEDMVDDFKNLLESIESVCAVTGDKSYVTQSHYDALEQTKDLVIKNDDELKAYNNFHVENRGYPVHFGVEPGCEIGGIQGARSLWDFMASAMKASGTAEIPSPNTAVTEYFRRNRGLVEFYLQQRVKAHEAEASSGITDEAKNLFKSDIKIDDNFFSRELQSPEFKRWLMENNNRGALWVLIYGTRGTRKLETVE